MFLLQSVLTLALDRANPSTGATCIFRHCTKKATEGCSTYHQKSLEIDNGGVLTVPFLDKGIIQSLRKLSNKSSQSLRRNRWKQITPYNSLVYTHWSNAPPVIYSPVGGALGNSPITFNVRKCISQKFKVHNFPYFLRRENTKKMSICDYNFS